MIRVSFTRGREMALRGIRGVRVAPPPSSLYGFWKQKCAIAVPAVGRWPAARWRSGCGDVHDHIRTHIHDLAGAREPGDEDGDQDEQEDGFDSEDDEVEGVDAVRAPEVEPDAPLLHSLDVAVMYPCHGENGDGQDN